MDDNIDIDDLFRGGIEPYQDEPSDKVWKILDQQLDKKAAIHYRAVIFRLKCSLVLLLLTVASFSGYYLFKASAKPDADAKKISQQQNSNLNNFPFNETEQASNTEIKKESKSNAVKRASRVTKKRTGIHQLHKVVQEKFPVSFAYKTTVEKTNYHTGNEQQATSLLNQQESPGDFFALREESKLISMQETTIPAADPTEAQGLPAREENKSPDENSNDVSLENKDSVLRTFVPELQIPKYTKVEIDSISRKKIKERLSVSLYFSPDFTRNYRQDNDPTDDESEDDYNSEEVSDFSYNLGLLVGYDVTKNWTIRAGFSYAHLAQIIKPKVAYARMGPDGVTHYQFNTSYGSSALKDDQNYAPVVGDSLKILSNSFQSLRILSLPLIAKYQYTKNKFGLYAQAGLSANFIAGERMVVSVPGQRQSIQGIEGLNKLYLGGILGVGISYNPYKKLSLLLEPTLRGAITSINKNTPVITRPFSFGIAVGAGWHF